MKIKKQRSIYKSRARANPTSSIAGASIPGVEEGAGCPSNRQAAGPGGVRSPKMWQIERKSTKIEPKCQK
jgi:hypothetical protein